jgi:hypothetical protein
VAAAVGQHDGQLPSKVNRSYLKNRILVQYQGRADLQTGGIHRYVEDLKRKPNAEIGPKDFFEMASSANQEILT